MIQRLLLHIACLLLPFAVTSAQKQDTTRSLNLGEVEVRGAQTLRTVNSTAPTYQLERDQLLRQGVSDMGEALHRLPGITLRDYGGAGGMKTVSVRGFGASHTGVSYDGVVLSECQSGEIDLSRYSIDQVERLQLTIGDNDDLFLPARQAATPALLSIETTHRPDCRWAQRLTSQVKVGSFGYVSPFLRYERNLRQKLWLMASGEYTYAENDYPFTLENGAFSSREHRTNSRMNQGHGELNMLWLPTTHSELSAKVYYYDNDRQLPGIVRYYTSLSRETLHDRTAFGQVQYIHRWEDRWALKALSKWNWASSSYRDPLYPGGVRDADYWQREGYASACLLFTPTARWAFDYSADYIYNSLNSSLTTDTRPYRHTVLQSLTAKWSMRQLKATARLLHSLYLNDAKQGEGARNMHRLSPSLSLSYQPFASQQFFVRASYKNIFRAPTFNESYYFHYGSTDLQPESTDQLNIGLTYASIPSKHTELRLTLDGYQNHVEDKIVSVPHNMFIWQCINMGKVRVRGLDATLSARRQLSGHHSVELTANYSYQQVHNRTNPDSPYYGLQLAYMPEHQGAASLCWENPWVNLVLHMHAMSDRWTTHQHATDTHIGGYAEWGLTAYRRLSIGRQQLDLRLDLKNLFDKQYELVGRYPMPGRSYQISISHYI